MKSSGYFTNAMKLEEKKSRIDYSLICFELSIKLKENKNSNSQWYSYLKFLRHQTNIVSE